jgi:ABC-2 type transport system permease protein
MSTASISLPKLQRRESSRSVRILLTEIRFEFLRALRTRAYSLSVIGFPVMFYILFGLVLNRGENLDGVLVSKYMLGGYAVFGALGAAIFGVGVGVAMDLSAGWLELKRASPMPPLAYLLAKCCTAMLFGVIIVSVLTLLGVSFGHVHLSLAEYGRMVGFTVVGAVPFACLGLAVAFSVPPSSAGGIANIIYIPMSFCSGLWVPLKFLPHVMQKFAEVLPTYHLAQLMLHSLGAPTPGTAISHWLGLLGFTLIMLGLAWIAFRRREENS